MLLTTCNHAFANIHSHTIKYSSYLLLIHVTAVLNPHHIHLELVFYPSISFLLNFILSLVKGDIGCPEFDTNHHH